MHALLAHYAVYRHRLTGTKLCALIAKLEIKVLHHSGKKDTNNYREKLFAMSIGSFCSPISDQCNSLRHKRSDPVLGMCGTGSCVC